MSKRAAILALLVLWTSAGLAKEEAPAATPGWPREFYTDDGYSLVVYQPQVQEWKNYRSLVARAAVELTVPDSKQPMIGGIELRTPTEADHDTHTVLLKKIHVSKVVFPGLESKDLTEARKVVRDLVPTGPVTVEMDRLVANLDREQVTMRNTTVSIRPPKVIVAHDQAILVVLASDPVFEPIEGTGLEGVANTQDSLFRDAKSQSLYLLYEASWLKADQLAGPWKPASELPDGFTKLPSGQGFDEIKNKVPGVPLKEDEAPKVFVATEPTELIVVYGEPKLEAIPRTKLEYAVNTESDLFRHADGNWYFLVSGRWFRTKELDKGPWSYCGNELPPDFAKIPEDHTCGRVLASVPGTDQAQEAVISAHISQTAQVSRKDTTLEVTYDGEPEWKEISGTKVSFATNTSFDVFSVEGAYYCCYEAVWFVAQAPNGPWTVCDKVPEEIYKIPATSPKYNDTFAYVYGSDEDNVYVGYLPGYYCSYVYNGVVVYCTGYYYVYPRRYWRHWWRWRRRHWARVAHYQRFRPTYGHARHYDHLTGRYVRSEVARTPRAVTHVPRGAYAGWGKGVQRTAMRKERPSHRVKERPAKANRDLYTTRDGQVYRRGKDGHYDRYHNGNWQRADARQRNPRTNHHLSSSNRARTQGAMRRQQYTRYRSSYGMRTRSYRRGGGMRMGGGRGRR